MGRLPLRPIAVVDGVGHVPLSKGLVALVDAADIPLIAGSNWHASKGTTAGYYARTNAPSKISMHELLMGEQFVDHANRNGLDNRRANLRRATRSQQAANTGLRHDNRSGYRGVDRYRGKWRAQMQARGKRLYQTGFTTAAAAAAQYDEWARQEFGEFAYQNYPDNEGSAA